MKTQCCQYDTDGDGNCHIHSAPGVYRDTRFNEKKIVVPKGMIEAVIDHHPSKGALQSDPDMLSTDTVTAVLEAAIRWMIENPIVPSTKDADKLWREAHTLSADSKTGHAGKDMLIEWQRMMFLAPEPEVPEEVKDLMSKYADPKLQTDGLLRAMARGHNEDIIEAYRRGQKSRE